MTVSSELEEGIMPGVLDGIRILDFGTACLSAFGTLAALYERGKSGNGQKVEGALLRTAIAFANSVLIEQSLTGVDRTAIRNRGFNSAPMSEWCASKSCAEALAELEKASIVAGQVYSPQQALDDDHIRAAHLLEERAYPGLDRTVPLAPTPIELSETPGTYRRPAPLLGEHTDEILESLGYGAAAIAALRAERVI